MDNHNTKVKPTRPKNMPRQGNRIFFDDSPRFGAC